MNIDLSNYTIDQLTQLQSKVNKLISDYSDGHIYICKIKSYGRNSTNKNIRNPKLFKTYVMSIMVIMVSLMFIQRIKT